jgi:hypothetical protein
MIVRVRKRMSSLTSIKRCRCEGALCPKQSPNELNNQLNGRCLATGDCFTRKTRSFAMTPREVIPRSVENCAFFREGMRNFQPWVLYIFTLPTADGRRPTMLPCQRIRQKLPLAYMLPLRRATGEEAIPE